MAKDQEAVEQLRRKYNLMAHQPVVMAGGPIMETTSAGPANDALNTVMWSVQPSATYTSAQTIASK